MVYPADDGSCLPNLTTTRRVRVWAIVLIVTMPMLATFSVFVPNPQLAAAAGIATVSSICGLVYRLSSALATGRSYTCTLAGLVATAIVVLAVFSLAVPSPAIAWVAGTALVTSLAGLLRRLGRALSHASEVPDGTA